MKKFVFFLVVLLSASVFAQDLPRIAVYVTGDASSENEKRALGTLILATLVNSGRYMGIERSRAFLAEIEREQITQRSGAVDDNQISALGRQFGVKYVCIADITPAFGAFQVSARIVDVETARIVFIGEASSPLKTMDDLTRVSDEVVHKMFSMGPLPTGPTTMMSVGVGGFFASDFGGGITWSNPAAGMGMPYTGWGIYWFFDIEYAEFFVGFSSGSGSWKTGNVEQDSMPNMQRTYINFGALAKYPIPLSNDFRAYPLLGLDYELSVKSRLRHTDGRELAFDGNDGNHQASVLSALWFKVGAGIEIGIRPGVYIRPEILYGLRTANTFEKGEAEAEKEYDRVAKPRLGHGLTLRLGGGFRF
ncbi:MAG: CsgG/HfaB family protein [Chitinispirillales bacterium]|jgi:TolB-like protein|nr:CsgG/HfaB family protein [Chitinispirillales bacterium]